MTHMGVLYEGFWYFGIRSKVFVILFDNKYGMSNNMHDTKAFEIYCDETCIVNSTKALISILELSFHNTFNNTYTHNIFQTFFKGQFL